MFRIYSLFITILLMGTISCAQEKLLSPKAVATGEYVEVNYGQPSKRGRVIFGEGKLVPYGEVWRTGANEATEITFETDAEFGGQLVKEGTYTLFTIPTKDDWTVILNAQLGQWGAYEYDKYKSKDILKTTVPSYSLDKTVEQLTFSVTDTSVIIKWDKTGVTIPVKIISN